MHTIPAIFEDGVFRPIAPVQLPEGTKVEVLTNLDTLELSKKADARERLLKLLGSIDAGFALGANNDNIDHHLSSQYAK